jgi:Tol biopolymer transport system component
MLPRFGRHIDSRLITAEEGVVMRSAQPGHGRLQRDNPTSAPEATRWCTQLFVALLVIGAFGTRAVAANGPSADGTMCSVAQITNSTHGSFLSPSISGSGTRVVFRSFISGIPSSGGLFVLDVLTNTVTQLDSDPGFPPNLFVDIDDTGTLIASASRANPTGENADGNLEIFVFDTTMGTVTQITHTTGDGPATAAPSTSGDGTRIAFSFAADLTGENPDGNVELFVFDLPTGSVTQATHTSAGFSSFPAISNDGNQIAFESTADMTGGNPDGNSEIFFIDTRTGSVTQVTRTTGAFNAGASLSGDGTRLAFFSNGNLIGENPDANSEIFLFDTRTAALIQVTRTTNAGNAFPALSGDGTRVAFNSAADLTGENPDRNSEVFLFDGITGALSQITRTVGTSSSGQALGQVSARGISNNGTRIAFVSSQDVTGGNPDRNQEIFLATCQQRDVDAAQLLQETITLIASYDLRRLGNSLPHKLQLASDFVVAGDLRQACGVLTGFLNQVRAQAGKAMTPDQARELTMRVTRIRNVIGC